MSLFYGRMTEARSRELEVFAEFLWEEYSADGRIEPIEILKEKEITYSFSDYQECFDGLLEYQNNRFHVYLNQHRLKILISPGPDLPFHMSWDIFLSINIETA